MMDVASLDLEIQRQLQMFIVSLCLSALWKKTLLKCWTNRKIKNNFDATDKLIEIYDKHYVSFEEPLEDILDSHFHHKELREYFGGSENNLYKLYE